MLWNNCIRKSCSSSADHLAQERFLRRKGLNPQQARQQLQQTNIVIETLADIDTEPLRALLRAHGLTVNREPASLVVAVTDTYLTAQRLDRLLRERLRQGTPCLVLQPTGVRPLAGPLLRPEGLCWSCLKQTMSRHHPAPQALQKLKQTEAKVAAPAAYLPATLLQVYAFAVQAIVEYVLQGRVSLLEGCLVSFAGVESGQECHEVVPWVLCTSCLAERTVAIPSVPALRLDLSPEAIEAAATADTLVAHLAVLERITSPYTGVLATQHIKQDPETGGPFYWAIVTHPFYNHALPATMNVRGVLNELLFNASEQSSALGASRADALIRAGMEAYERCAATYRGDEYYVTKTQHDLGQDALSNTALYTGDPTGATLKPLPDTTVADWTPVWSLTHSLVRWVLMSFCYFGFPRGREYAPSRSRGTAAGPTLEFCVLKGLYELIETRAVAAWETRRHAMPCVDLESFQEPIFEDILAFHKAKNRDLWVLDLSVPAMPTFVFAAISYDPDSESIVFGSAAHNVPKKGIRSAMLECTQMLPNLRRAEAQGSSAAHVSFGLQDRHHGDTLRDEAYYGERTLAGCSLQDLVDRLADAGIEVLVKDLTREEVPIHVARVLFSIND